MTRWADKVRVALRDPRVLQGISTVAAAWMQDHIDDNYGRGSGGTRVEHAPLKTITSEYWTERVPRGVTASGMRTRVVQTRVKRKTPSGDTVYTMGSKVIREYRITQTSYRAGGQPLRDTGNLYRSLSATGSANGGNLRLTMSGMRYGLYQDRGFRTKGPNYIPLTRKGVRQHGTGNNPRAEGLVGGRDYLMAWKGVTVPSRPFIMPTRADLRSFGKSIYLGLKSVLKGT